MATETFKLGGGCVVCRDRCLIDEDNCIQQLFNYTGSKYDDLCRRYANECPYPVRLPPDMKLKQEYSWFMTEKVLPATGRTVLDEFVEKYVQPVNPGLAKKMLGLKDVTRGTFEFLSVGPRLMTVRHFETGRTFTMVPISEGFSRLFGRGDRTLLTRIYPWGKYYRFAGIVVKHESEEEMARRLGLVTPDMLRNWIETRWIGQAESILVGPHTKLSAAMNKYPWQWVDGICMALGIGTKGVKKGEKVKRVVGKLDAGYIGGLLNDRDRIPDGSLRALLTVVNNGYIMKFGGLSKSFSYEDDFWWNERPPRSEIGRLRLHGLLIKGRMPIGGRLFTVAAVPVEVRPLIASFVKGRASRPA